MLPVATVLHRTPDQANSLTKLSAFPPTFPQYSLHKLNQSDCRIIIIILLPNYEHIPNLTRSKFSFQATIAGDILQNFLYASQSHTDSKKGGAGTNNKMSIEKLPRESR